jgi:hypothetical protein
MWSTRRTSRRAERLTEEKGGGVTALERLATGESPPARVRRGGEPTEEPMMEPIAIEATMEGQNWEVG